MMPMPITQPMPPKEILSSVDLLVRAKSGDQDALNQLLVRYLPRLKRWATGRLPRGLRTMMDTGDLVQEAMINAIPHLATFEIRSDRALLAYLREMVRNRIIDLHRRARRRPARREFPVEVPAAGIRADDALIASEQFEIYRRALAMIAKSDRDAIRLRLEERLEFAEIAKLLGKHSADAARMAVSRSIGRLAAKMEELGAGEPAS
jgi:RNA polymerase sigma-70 factor (ECF subfamily)